MVGHILLGVLFVLVTVDQGCGEKAILCLLDKHPKEMLIDCGENNVISINHAVYSYDQTTEKVNDTCSVGPETECIELDNNNPSLLGKCMAKQSCLVAIKPKDIDVCGFKSNNYKVDYKCIAGNGGDYQSIIDVCGDMSQGDKITRELGYIQTPNYPDAYPPDAMCSCNITAMKRDTDIALTLMDLELNGPSPDTTCGVDYMEYTKEEQAFGTGVNMCDNELHHTYHTGESSVFVNFRSNGDESGRGFWVKYEATDSKGEAANVKVSCLHQKQARIRTNQKCFPARDGTEVYLGCAGLGVIHILYAVHGRKDPDSCSPKDNDICLLDALRQHKTLENCMGQEECTYTVNKEYLPRCNMYSEFYKVEYQCIENSYSPNNIVDICGDSLNGKSITQSHGYIETPNYPTPYPQNIECQCKLSTANDAGISIVLLDIDFSDSKCIDDGLEYTMTSDSGWGQGISLCNTPHREPVNTKNSTVWLRFKAGNHDKNRGFWARYSAMTSNGEDKAVTLQCEQLKNYYSPDVNTESTKESTDNNDLGANNDRDDGTSTGLIIGLCVIVVLMVIIVTAMVAYKCTRRNEPPLADQTSSGSLPYNGGSTEYATYGTQKTPDQYKTLDNESNTSSINYQATAGRPKVPDNEYTYIDHPNRQVAYHGQQGLAAYNNPMFEGGDELPIDYPGTDKRQKDNLQL